MLTKYYGKVQCSQENPMVSYRDLMKIIEAEKATWERESIGYNAVKSVEMAITEKNNN